jgi:hypothetical protein
MENSSSLTGCNRLTCKGDGKLFLHEDQVNTTISDDEDGIFRNQRNFPTVNLTSFDSYDRIFRGIFRRFLNSCEGVFQQFSVSFPTINQNQKQHYLGSILCPSGLQSSTLPLRHTYFINLVIFFTEVLLRYYTDHLHQNCVLHLSAMCLPLLYSVHLRQYCVKLGQYCVFLSQYSVHLHQYCVFLRQYCVNLRQCCDFLVSAAFSFLNTLFSFVITLFTFVNTSFVFISTVVILRQYCVFLRQNCVNLVSNLFSFVNTVLELLNNLWGLETEFKKFKIRFCVYLILFTIHVHFSKD